jgi:allophanate hydrolase subunit 2
MFLPVTHCSKLNRGDVLSIKSFEQTHTKYFSKIKNLDFTENELKTYPGPEFEDLSSNQKKLLEATKFTISNLNNRMGYQLNELIENSLNPIITSAVLPGTVQLTPGGKLIVLMRDAQTTGGYPRVLQLSDQAINLLAQKKTSDKVTFSMISMNQS